MSESHENISRRGKLSEEQQLLLRQRLAAFTANTNSGRQIPRRTGSGPARLSFGQQRLWLLDRLDPGGSTYNVPYVYRLEGMLDLTALEKALTSLVQRHDILRTTFRVVEDEPLQFIDHEAAPEPVFFDYSGLPSSDRDASLRSLIESEALRGFDLSTGPLMRMSIAKLSQTEHVLLLIFHHIIFDGWSEGIFFKELEQFYSAAAAGNGVSLDRPSVQYADYAEWQRSWLQGEELVRQVSYWKNRLAGASPELDMTLDHPRPSKQTFRGLSESFQLSEELHQRLVQLSLAEGTTLYMTLLTAFGVLLGRYTGQSDLVVGTPLAGRIRPETESMIGFFVNTLVLRTDLSGNPTFRDLLKKTRDIVIEAFEHQDLPFEKLVEELQPRRTLTHNPLFQAMFVLQSASKGDPTLPGIRVTRIRTNTGSAKFDISISLTEKPDGLAGWVECNADIFDYSTMKRIVRHFETLLKNIAANPSSAIAEVSLMDDAERHRVLVEWNNTATGYPSDADVGSIFEDQVRSTPDAIALVGDERSLSYADLNARANKLAWFLVDHGCSPDATIGVALDRSIDMIVSLLAILKAGGAYLPLNAAYPEERSLFILDEARAPILITTKSSQERYARFRGKLIYIDEEWDHIDREKSENLERDIEGSRLAYVMFTSGSTGTPKGVCVPHRGIVRLVKATNYAHFGPDEVFLQFSPVSFDTSTFEIWGALLNGGTLVLAPAGHPSMEELGAVVQKHKVTTVWLTAALFHHMVDGALEYFSGVRQMLAGGDVLSVPHVQKYARRFPHCAVIDGYGPTENSTFTTCYTVTDPDALRSSVPIGKPISNTTVYILDPMLQPVPVGVPGELYIGGDGVARGYLNRPELTAERFIPDPFVPATGQTLYKSGDKVRYLENGDIEFLGRFDTQVKLRGFRIELGEIETILSQHPAVAQAVINAQPDNDGDKRLIGYCILQPGSETTAENLQVYLKSRLPDYMVPSRIFFLESLPLNPNGKVDREQLTVLCTELEEASAGASEAPVTATEKVLAEIWQQALHLRNVDVSRSFFEMGGHSLLAMQVISRVRQVFQISLPLVSLFENPTISSLSAVIEEKFSEEMDRQEERNESDNRENP